MADMEENKNEIFDSSGLSPYGGVSKWLKHVMSMSFFVYHTRGLLALIRRVMIYVKENSNLPYLIFSKSRYDVLYVSGCPGGSRYYRCKNQGEMLADHGITSRTYGQNLLGLLYLVDKFDVFIFQRVIYGEYIGEMVQLIKNKKKTIIYETDDLVHDPTYLPYMDIYHRMGKTEKSWYENGIGRELLEDRDVRHCVVATDYLNEVLKRKYPDKKIFVSYNKMGQEQILLAKKTLAQRDRIKMNDGKIRIGYFSGSNSHNKDFNVIADVLVGILKEHKNASLMIVGQLELAEKFSGLKDRIDIIPFVSSRKLPGLIVRADINIAPLEIDNPFCRAKSALKFFEAGILEVPTIATATGDFMRCIRNGENGFIARDEAEWKDALTLLIRNKELRERIGKQARIDSLENHTFFAKSNGSDFVEFLKERTAHAKK